MAALLKANDIKAIGQKQGAIAELAKMDLWRQDFSAVAKLTETQTPMSGIFTWLANYTSFMPKTMRWLPRVFSVASLGVIIAYFMAWIPEAYLIYWILLGLLVTGGYARKITKLTGVAGRVLSTFQQYGQLVRILEQTQFESTLLVQQQGILLQGKRNTSDLIREFSGVLGDLDRNGNIIYMIFANG